MIEASGLDLITGDVQPSQDSPLGSMMAQAEVDAEAPDGTTDQDEQQPGGGVLEDGRWWALAGAVLIGLSLVLGFVLKPARTAALGASVAGVLALVDPTEGTRSKTIQSTGLAAMAGHTALAEAVPVQTALAGRLAEAE